MRCQTARHWASKFQCNAHNLRLSPLPLHHSCPTPAATSSHQFTAIQFMHSLLQHAPSVKATMHIGRVHCRHLSPSVGVGRASCGGPSRCKEAVPLLLLSDALTAQLRCSALLQPPYPPCRFQAGSLSILHCNLCQMADHCSIAPRPAWASTIEDSQCSCTEVSSAGCEGVKCHLSSAYG